MWVNMKKLLAFKILFLLLRRQYRTLATTRILEQYAQGSDPTKVISEHLVHQLLRN